MMLTKMNMFGGDDGKRDRASTTSGRAPTPRSRCRTRCSRSRSSSTPTASASTSTQIYSWYSEQGWGGTRLTFDATRSSDDQAAGREDPQGAAEVGARHHRHRQPAAVRRRWRTGPEGAGAAGRRFDRDAGRARPTTSCRSWPSARNCATCASTSATSNSELTVRVDRERAAAFGFSAQQVAQLRRPGAARCAAARVPPRRKRGAGVGALRRRRAVRRRGHRQLHGARAGRPHACRCWRWSMSR